MCLCVRACVHEYMHACVYVCVHACMCVLLLLHCLYIPLSFHSLLLPTLPLSPVMRASGSYRVLLNTHLWAQMKCDRANQKNIRITAQSTDGKISVFLIMVRQMDFRES